MGGQWRGAEILNIKQKKDFYLDITVCYSSYKYATQGQIKTKQVEGANGHRDSYFGMVSFTSPFVIFMYIV